MYLHTYCTYTWIQIHMYMYCANMQTIFINKLTPFFHSIFPADVYLCWHPVTKATARVSHHSICALWTSALSSSEVAIPIIPSGGKCFMAGRRLSLRATLCRFAVILPFKVTSGPNHTCKLSPTEHNRANNIDKNILCFYKGLTPFSILIQCPNASVREPDLRYMRFKKIFLQYSKLCFAGIILLIILTHSVWWCWADSA